MAQFLDTLLVVVCVVSLASAADGDASVRSLKAGATCMNTKQGRLIVADDQGRLCSRKDLDYSSGCCQESAPKYSCQMCNPADKCCSEFESCVSCCMDPKHQASEHMKDTPRIRGRPETGTWDNPFSYCKAVCRTHRTSTSHENSYIGPRHHCFSPLGKPLLFGPAPPSLSKVTVLVSNDGESCNHACKRNNKVCSAAHLTALNSCDRLREHLGCEAGCTGFTNQRFHPAYVSTVAPKSLRPAMCMVTAREPDLTCGAKEQYVLRLCPCVEEAPGGQAGAATGQLRGGGAGAL